MNAKVKYIIGILGLTLFVFGVWYFRAIITYMLIAVALSILGQPIVHLLEKIKVRKKQLPRWLCAGVTLVVFWCILVLFFRTFIPLIIMEANEFSNINVDVFYNNLHRPFTELLELLQKLGYFENEAEFTHFIKGKIVTLLDVDYFSGLFTGVTSTLGTMLIAFFAVSFMSFFFLKDSSLFSKGVFMFVPDKYTDEVTRVMESIKHLLARYLGGIMLEVFFVMLLVTLGLWLVGIAFQHALVCGLVAGILNVIPYIGPWIGASFSIVIGVVTNIHMPFMSDLLPLILYMILVFAVVQTIDNVLFQPLVYSSSVNAHPLEIFIVIMMAGSMAGVGGMVLAIPTYTVLRVIAKEFLSGFKVVQKLTQNI